jgi:iron(III) transport system ATP-binding protein
MVFQDGALFPHLTVVGNILYGIRNGAKANDRVREVLDQVGLDGLGERFPDQLSGGQQQRVALARALAPRPQIILLDEPFANLDASLREKVRQEVRSVLESAGITAILVTHDQEEAFSFADEVAVMARGRILQVGTPEEVYHDPVSEEVASFVGSGHMITCRVWAGRFKSSLGEATCRAPDGDGLVFLRPEDLSVARWLQGEGAVGTVVGRRFFGHDVLDTVQLASGETIEVRSLSSTTVPVGSPVRLALRERTYRVFPIASDA